MSGPPRAPRQDAGGQGPSEMTLEGTVVRGEGRGRRLGFPTANLRVAAGTEPPQGVFAARVHRAGVEFAAVANIGTRPTFDGQEVSVEVHLLDFEGDLYDERLRVTLERRLRGERRFDTVEELRRQIAGDIQQARSR